MIVAVDIKSRVLSYHRRQIPLSVHPLPFPHGRGLPERSVRPFGGFLRFLQQPSGRSHRFTWQNKRRTEEVPHQPELNERGEIIAVRCPENRETSIKPRVLRIIHQSSDQRQRELRPVCCLLRGIGGYREPQERTESLQGGHRDTKTRDLRLRISHHLCRLVLSRS